ncbi:hypothetical protein LguiA_015842 [Lonicera macranthoides]
MEGIRMNSLEMFYIAALPKIISSKAEPMPSRYIYLLHSLEIILNQFLRSQIQSESLLGKSMKVTVKVKYINKGTRETHVVANHSS